MSQIISKKGSGNKKYYKRNTKNNQRLYFIFNKILNLRKKLMKKLTENRIRF